MGCFNRLKAVGYKESLTEILCQLLQQQDADIFGGNPKKYQCFLAMFTEFVQNRIKDLVGRLTRLIKLTIGDTKNMIKRCIHLSSESGYHTAMMLLNQSFHSPHSLFASYRKEIKGLPPAKPRNASSSRFHNFKRRCETFSKVTE